MGAPLNLIGKRYGRLLVLEFAGHKNSPSGSRRVWKCMCDCGNITYVTTLELQNGDTKSCGCFKTETTSKRLTTHGDSKTRLYQIWKAMRKRCNNPNSSDYKWYGERGIHICDEWSTYEPFKIWSLEHGYADDLTIDRINTNGNYAPDNCRWIPRTMQCNNRRSNVLYEYHGIRHNIKEWSDILGIKYSTLYHRLKDGITIEQMI